MDNKNDMNYNKDKRDKIVNVVKDVINDRAISSKKDEIIGNGISLGVGGLGLAGGITKELGKTKWRNLSKIQQKNILKNSFLNAGIPAFAISSIITDGAVPSVRLKKLHKKEFGTNPDPEDYAKLISVKSIPTAAYYGMLYKNRSKLVDNLTKTIQNAPKIIKPSTKWADRKKAIKALGAGAATGGSLKLLGDAADLAQLAYTPETIIKSKKKSKGVNNNMKLKNAFEIIDEAYEKMASYDEDIMETKIDKTAEEIVNSGYEKLAAHHSLLKDVGDILSGKNVRKAKGALNAAESGAGLLNNANKVVNVADDSLNTLVRNKQKALKDWSKGKRIRIDRNGDLVKTRFSGKAEDELANALNGARSHIGTLNKEYRNSQKEINDIRGTLEKAKKQTASDREGVFSKVDNIVHSKQFNKNRKYNEKIDDIVDRMKQNQAISNKDLAEVKKTFTGKKKVIGNQDFLDEIRRFNVASANANKAQKQMGRSKVTIGDIQHELNAVKNSDELKKKMRAVNDAKNISDRTSTVKNTAGTIGEIGRAAGIGNPANAVANKARNRYNKELAKTVGAYGALGTGAYAGAKALENAKDKNNQQNSSQPVFTPHYRFS